MSEKDLPDFLGGEPMAAPPEAAPAEAAAPETPAAEAKPADPAPAPTAETPPAAPAAQPEVHAVPLPTFLDLRDRLTAAEKEAKDLREWRQQQEAARNRRPPPSRDEDPEAYEAHRESQIRGALYDQKLDMSRFMAEQRHGEDVVKTAYEWGLRRCDEDPHFNAKVATARDPVGLVVAEWRRDQIASKVDPTRYEAFLAWEAAQTGAAQPNEGQPQPAAAQPAARPAAPRPSIAAAPSAGSSSTPIPRDGEAQFDVMFR